jgi:hypothetical protein
VSALQVREFGKSPLPRCLWAPLPVICVGGAGSQTPQSTGIAGAVATLQYPSRKRPYPERARCSHTKLSADSSTKLSADSSQ